MSTPDTATPLAATPARLVVQRYPFGSRHRILAGKRTVAICPLRGSEDEGRFIVTACNAHDDLLATAERALRYIRCNGLGDGRAGEDRGAGVGNRPGATGSRIDHYPFPHDR